MNKGRRLYQQHFQAGYSASQDQLRVTIPDCVHFPSTRVFMGLLSNTLLKLSPNAFPGAVLTNPRLNEVTPGCREVLLPGVKNIGRHFRCMVVKHEMLAGNDVLIHLPAANERLPPRRHKGSPSPTPPGQRELPLPSSQEPTTSQALICIGDMSLTFNVPLEELFDLASTWKSKGYQV